MLVVVCALCSLAPMHVGLTRCARPPSFLAFFFLLAQCAVQVDLTGGLVRAYGGAAVASLLAAEVVEVVPRLALRVRYPPEDVGVVYAALGAYSPRAAEAPRGDAAADAGLLEAVCEVPREAVDVLARTLRDATSGRAQLVAAGEAPPRAV